jgi:four helix bundle protein
MRVVVRVSEGFSRTLADTMADRHAANFNQLEVYKRARELAKNIFERTKAFPSEETYALTSQIRRSSRSIGAQIAEAWSKRRYKRHFVSKLTDADSEQRECQHWVLVSMDRGYLTKEEAVAIINELLLIGRMVQTMINKAHLFCYKAGRTR